MKEKKDSKNNDKLESEGQDPINAEMKVESPESQADERRLQELVHAFNAYGRVFTAQDTANMTAAQLQAEDLNLKFAIFAELRQLNDLLKPKG